MFLHDILYNMLQSWFFLSRFRVKKMFTGECYDTSPMDCSVLKDVADITCQFETLLFFSFPFPFVVVFNCFQNSCVSSKQHL